MPAVSRAALLATLPPETALAPCPAAAKIVVLDDDPSGTQTVHGLPVLTTWGVDELVAELGASERCIYLFQALTGQSSTPARPARKLGSSGSTPMPLGDLL